MNKLLLGLLLGFGIVMFGCSEEESTEIPSSIDRVYKLLNHLGADDLECGQSPDGVGKTATIKGWLQRTNYHSNSYIIAFMNDTMANSRMLNVIIPDAEVASTSEKINEAFSTTTAGYVLVEVTGTVDTREVTVMGECIVGIELEIRNKDDLNFNVAMYNDENEYAILQKSIVK